MLFFIMNMADEFSITLVLKPFNLERNMNKSNSRKSKLIKNNFKNS